MWSVFGDRSRIRCRESDLSRLRGWVYESRRVVLGECACVLCVVFWCTVSCEVGMGALSLSPGLIKGAVMLNTGFGAPTRAANLSIPHAVVKIPLLGELLLEVFFPIFDGMGRLQGDPDQ